MLMCILKFKVFTLIVLELKYDESNIFRIVALESNWAFRKMSQTERQICYANAQVKKVAKELLQNSNDSKATGVKFFLDGRNQDKKIILLDGQKSVRGHILVFPNNG